MLESVYTDLVTEKVILVYVYVTIIKVIRTLYDTRGCKYYGVCVCVCELTSNYEGRVMVMVIT